MKWRSVVLAGLIVALVAAGYQAYGWPGVAMAGGALVLWLLLQLNQTMGALQRAAHRPVGFVGSAVMLNARLQTGDRLLRVIALTRSLGHPLSAQDAQPEVYRWTDASASSVTCEFIDGRLARWELVRPAPE